MKNLFSLAIGLSIVVAPGLGQASAQPAQPARPAAPAAPARPAAPAAPARPAQPTNPARPAPEARPARPAPSAEPGRPQVRHDPNDPFRGPQRSRFVVTNVIPLSDHIRVGPYVVPPFPTNGFMNPFLTNAPSTVRGAFAPTNLVVQVPIRRLAPQQREDIVRLAMSLDAVFTVPASVTARQALVSSMISSTPTALRPPVQSFTKLANDLAIVGALAAVSAGDRVEVARNVNLLLNAHQLTPPQVQMLIGHTQALLAAYGVPVENVQALGNDLMTLVSRVSERAAELGLLEPGQSADPAVATGLTNNAARAEAPPTLTPAETLPRAPSRP